MVHTAFITLHAAAGIIAFTAGCLALRKRAYMTIYFWSLIALVVSLAAVVVLDWAGLDTVSRALFAALLGFGGFLIWQAVQARRLPTGDPELRARVIDHVGFTLIALFDGFVIILALDLGAPVWSAIVVAVAGVAVGRTAIELGTRRVASPRS